MGLPKKKFWKLEPRRWRPLSLVANQYNYAGLKVEYTGSMTLGLNTTWDDAFQGTR